jgi:hypothetical protein
MKIGVPVFMQRGYRDGQSMALLEKDRIID